MCKMKRKIIVFAMVGLIGMTSVGCQNKPEIQAKKAVQKNKVNNTQTVAKQKYSDDQRNKDILEMFPEYVANIRKILIDNDRTLHKDLDMKNVQVLLFSHRIHRAYLINSQNEKFGSPEEDIEYSTDTIPDKKVLPTAFGMIEFNEKKTYAFNVDNFEYIGNNKAEIQDEVIKIAVHELIHLQLQKKLAGKAEANGENMGSRVVSYPLDTMSRVYRSQQAMCYGQALLAKTEEERVEWIKKGNYFYEKYLSVDKANAADSNYDKVEGQARYFEYRAKAIASLENSELEPSKIEEVTRKMYLEKFGEELRNGIKDSDKVIEFYRNGSLAYANIYALGIQDEFGYQNPDQYLLNKYGSTENKEYENIGEKIKEGFDEKNQGIKKRMDTFTDQLNSDDYKTIIIPPLDGMYNTTMGFRDDIIDYLYNGEKAELFDMRGEIRLGDARIMQKYIETMMYEGHRYMNVPKEDIEIEDGRLSVQLKELKIYDCKFIEKDGMYILQE